MPAELPTTGSARASRAAWPWKQTKPWTVNYLAWDHVTARQAIVVLPRAWGPKHHPHPLPLVISPHGRNNFALNNARGYWQNLPAAGPFALVCPDGLARAHSAQTDPRRPAAEPEPLHVRERRSRARPRAHAADRRGDAAVARAAARPHLRPRQQHGRPGDAAARRALPEGARRRARQARRSGRVRRAVRPRRSVRLPHAPPARRGREHDRGGRHAAGERAGMEPRRALLQPQGSGVRRRSARCSPSCRRARRRGTRAAPSASRGKLASLPFPLRLYWSTEDVVVGNQERDQTGKLFAAIEARAPHANVTPIRGQWAHSHEFFPGKQLGAALDRVRPHLAALTSGGERLLERRRSYRCRSSARSSFFADPWNLEAITPPWLEVPDRRGAARAPARIAAPLPVAALRRARRLAHGDQRLAPAARVHGRAGSKARIASGSTLIDSSRWTEARRSATTFATACPSNRWRRSRRRTPSSGGSRRSSTTAPGAPRRSCGRLLDPRTCKNYLQKTLQTVPHPDRR